MKKCTHLEDEVKIVEWVLKKHLDRYKWFRGISNKTEAEIKFVQEYAWLLREVYCEFVCKEENCIKKDYSRHEDEQYLFPEDVDKDTDINKDHNYFEGKEDHIGL